MLCMLLALLNCMQFFIHLTFPSFHDKPTDGVDAIRYNDNSTDHGLLFSAAFFNVSFDLKESPFLGI